MSGGRLPGGVHRGYCVVRLSGGSSHGSMGVCIYLRCGSVRPHLSLAGGDNRFDHASGHSSGSKCVKYDVEK